MVGDNNISLNTSSSYSPGYTQAEYARNLDGVNPQQLARMPGVLSRLGGDLYIQSDTIAPVIQESLMIANRIKQQIATASQEDPAFAQAVKPLLEPLEAFLKFNQQKAQKFTEQSTEHNVAVNNALYKGIEGTVQRAYAT